MKRLKVDDRVKLFELDAYVHGTIIEIPKVRLGGKYPSVKIKWNDGSVDELRVSSDLERSDQSLNPVNDTYRFLLP